MEQGGSSGRSRFVNGNETHFLLRVGIYDLVVLDITPPGRDGPIDVALVERGGKAWLYRAEHRATDAGRGSR